MSRLLYIFGRAVGAWQDWRDRLEDASGRRVAVLALTMAYVVGLAVMLLGTALGADRAVFWSVTAFLPPLGWLVPLLVLAPLAALWHRWLLVVDAACVVLVLGPFMGFCLGHPREVPPGGVAVRVGTINDGTNLGTSPMPWLTARAPDLVAVQEVNRQGPELAAVLPGFTAETIGEYLLLSRWPLSEVGVPEGLDGEPAPYAARCVVEHPARRFVLYTVHLPTRRDIFGDFRGRGLFDGGTWARAREDLAERRRLAQALLARIEEETLPVIVAGDFNFTPLSVSHDRFSASLTDAFASAGRGYGFTVPGITRNPVGLYRPWLRLDYVFAGPAWEVLSAEVEPARQSQHRAMLAELWLGE